MPQLDRRAIRSRKWTLREWVSVRLRWSRLAQTQFSGCPPVAAAVLAFRGCQRQVFLLRPSTPTCLAECPCRDPRLQPELRLYGVAKRFLPSGCRNGGECWSVTPAPRERWPFPFRRVNAGNRRANQDRP